MSTTPDTPDKEEWVYEPWNKTLLRVGKGLFKIAGWYFGIFIALVLAATGYQQLDLNGYIHHERTLDVYMANNWLVGENRDCWLHQVLGANGKPTGKLDSLQCPVGLEDVQPHNVSVTFKGIIDPKDIGGKGRSIPLQWICTRGSESFTCVVNPNPLYPSK